MYAYLQLHFVIIGDGNDEVRRHAHHRSIVEGRDANTLQDWSFALNL